MPKKGIDWNYIGNTMAGVATGVIVANMLMTQMRKTNTLKELVSP